MTPTKSAGAFIPLALCIILTLTFIALSIRSCVRTKIQTIEQTTLKSKD